MLAKGNDSYSVTAGCVSQAGTGPCSIEIRERVILRTIYAPTSWLLVKEQSFESEKADMWFAEVSTLKSRRPTKSFKYFCCCSPGLRNNKDLDPQGYLEKHLWCPVAQILFNRSYY